MKKDYKEKACERHQNLSKEGKEKNGNMVVKVTKFSQTMKKWTGWVYKTSYRMIKTTLL